MKVLIDAIPMTGLLTGIARYLRNMYTVMSNHSDVDLSYISGKTLCDSMPPLADSARWEKATGAVMKLPDPLVFALRAAHWLRYEQKLRGICKQNSFDLYHETAFVPAKLPGVPTVYSIYDLSLRRWGHTHPRERVWFFEYFLKRRLSYATHILTISEFIRQEIIEEFKVPPSMVSTVPLAADPLFGPRPIEQIKSVRRCYNLPDSYLLFVGTLEPRKNIDVLIAALQAGTVDIPLVLAGWQGWGDKEWMEKIRKAGLAGRVHIIGHVPDEDLVAIYNGATALVYPSLYEGFGLPILEAMACGCPVICSNVASMPEVAGNAALLIDPADSEELAANIEIVAHDNNKRAEMIEQGRQQAAKFSWERTAGETLDVFKKVVEKQ